LTGALPRQHWRSLQRSPDSLLDFSGPTSKKTVGRKRGKRERRKKGEGRKGKKGKGKQRRADKKEGEDKKEERGATSPNSGYATTTL